MYVLIIVVVVVMVMSVVAGVWAHRQGQIVLGELNWRLPVLPPPMSLLDSSAGAASLTSSVLALRNASRMREVRSEELTKLTLPVFPAPLTNSGVDERIQQVMGYFKAMESREPPPGEPDFVVGAAQAWTRRLFDRFGPLPEGVVAEDLLMVFRAIVGGGAMTLAEPLVRYRRGGISRRRRAMSARQVVVRLLKNNRHSLIELPQLLADARVAGQLEAVEAALQRQLAREVFIRDLFAANSLGERARLVARSSEVPLSQRLRFAVYAICPALLAPLFWAKRLAPRRE